MHKSKASNLHKIECSGTKDEIYNKVLEVNLDILVENFNENTL